MSGAKVIDLMRSCSGRSPRSRFRKVFRVSAPTSSQTHCATPYKGRSVSFACPCRVLTLVELALPDRAKFNLQVRAKCEQTAVAILDHKLARAPRHVGGFSN